jgi:CBS domain containing-hemolysin-like protein
MLGRVSAISVLVVLNGFFVAAEFALIRSRHSRLEAMARHGDWKARLAFRAAQNLPAILSANQIGVTLSSLAIGAITQDALGAYFAGWLAGLPVVLELSVRLGIGSAIALAVVTYFQVVFSELVPRGAALSHPEEVAGWLTPPLLLFAWLISPFATLLNRSAQLVLRIFGQHLPRGEENVHSPEELRILVERSEEGGALETQDANLIEGVFEFSEKNAREVMTPRTEIDALPLESTLEETLRVVEETHRSRYPVFEDSIDNVIGLILAKDLLPILHHPPASFALRQIMRPVHVVPGSREVEDVLSDFKRLKEHLAIVLDEYGGTAGLVTMEDLLEEIVGEILDEYDEPLVPEARDAGNLTLVPGSMNLGEFNERFALALPESDYTTIGGYVFGALGRLPVVGDRVAAAGTTLIVREMEGRRVEALAVEEDGRGKQPVAGSL